MSEHETMVALAEAVPNATTVDTTTSDGHDVAGPSCLVTATMTHTLPSEVLYVT